MLTSVQFSATCVVLRNHVLIDSTAFNRAVIKQSAVIYQLNTSVNKNLSVDMTQVGNNIAGRQRLLNLSAS